MPKGYRTSSQDREAAIAMAKTSLTQEEIARQLGISRRTLVRIWKKEGISRSAQESQKSGRITSVVEQRQTGTFDSLQTFRRQQHSDELREQFRLFSTYIRVPAPQDVFLWPGLTEYSYPINVSYTSWNGLTPRQSLYAYLQASGRQFQVSLDIEQTEHWKFLQSHLLAEKSPPIMEDYVLWVQGLGNFFSLCQRVLSEIIDQADGKIKDIMKGINGWQGVTIVSNWGERGLSEWFYEDIYSLKVDKQAQDKEGCQVKVVEEQPGFVALWRSGRWLAIGMPAEIDAYKDVYETVSEDVPKWRQTRKLLAVFEECQTRNQELLAKLNILDKRGTFEGTCDVCRPWYSRVAS